MPSNSRGSAAHLPGVSTPGMVRRTEDLLDAARARVPALDPAALRQRLGSTESLVLRDVREADEFRQGHLPGALHLPRGQLELRVDSVLPAREASVVVYCASGARAALAASTLVDLGYRAVSRLEPGFARWRELGHPVEVPRVFDEAQRDRYARQLRLHEVGEAGQRRLLDARVLCVGAGGLGSSALLYLAAAGVGTLGIADGDVVEVSNLQRQVLHTTARLGRRKVESAEETLRALNPQVRVVRFDTRLTPDTIDRALADFELVIDGSDNFATRYALNDAAVRARKPLVTGAVHRFEGQVTTVEPFVGPCYRCLFPRTPAPGLAPACAEAGVLGVLPGVIGTIQATEAIKLLLGLGSPLRGRLLVYDALAMRMRELRFDRDPGCAACGELAPGPGAAR